MTDFPPRPPGPRARAAFFDVDHTLVTSVSIFRFLAYWYAATGRPAHRYGEERQRLKAMTVAGVSREETNRAYFGLYRGADTALIARLAEDWFHAELALGGLFNESVLAALREHRANGDLVVFVSGSFPAVLEPLRRHCGADHVLCTRPETDPATGTYTGRLAPDSPQPMIGRAKAEAVRLFAAAHGVDLSASTAYGDHPSDVPLLSATGRAVVVGCDPRLRQLGGHAGWSSLPSSPGPGPLPLPLPLPLTDPVLERPAP